MTDAKIEPALTAEEWRARGVEWSEGDGPFSDVQYAGLDKNGMYANSGVEFGSVDLERRRHAIAALALYQQPFGFGGEGRFDVDALRCASDAVDFAYEHGYHEDGINVPAILRDLAARIEALLPPE